MTDDNNTDNRIYSIIDKAKAYQKTKTFTFIKEIQPFGREYYYSGFILKVYDDFLLFFEIKLMKEFPIVLDSIGMLEVVKHNEISEESAKNILNAYLKERI